MSQYLYLSMDTEVSFFHRPKIFIKAFIKFMQSSHHGECCYCGLFPVFGVIYGRVPKCHDCIPHVFVDRPIVLEKG